MLKQIFGQHDEYIEISRSGGHVILDLGYYDKKEDVCTEAERVRFSKDQIQEVINCLEAVIKEED